MPNLLQRSPDVRVDFVASVPLDLLNSMYFTFLAGQLEGVSAWPTETRAAMDPVLRAELDLLFSYPGREPGVMGALNDVSFVHRKQLTDVETLLRFVREMPAGGSESAEHPGIQGLAIYALRWPGMQPYTLTPGLAPRDAIGARLEGAPELDLSCIVTPDIGGSEAVLALFDDPEQVRARMLALIRRFYDEHYRRDEQRRLECMERSAAYHRSQSVNYVDVLLRELTGYNVSCLQDVPASYTDFICVPSVDAGPYNSCIDLPPVHGLHYACELRFISGNDHLAEDAHRLALVYRALGDEQRLRILRLLREGELYAQEIVEQTGLHQSVVSRHLTFMKAVGLLNVRRQNNMKFYSLNRDATGDLRHVIELYAAPAGAVR